MSAEVEDVATLPAEAREDAAANIVDVDEAPRGRSTADLDDAALMHGVQQRFDGGPVLQARPVDDAEAQDRHARKSLGVRELEDLFAGTQPYLDLKGRLFKNFNGTLQETLMNLFLQRVIPEKT